MIERRTALVLSMLLVGGMVTAIVPVSSASPVNCVAVVAEPHVGCGLDFCVPQACVRGEVETPSPPPLPPAPGSPIRCTVGPSIECEYEVCVDPYVCVRDRIVVLP